MANDFVTLTQLIETDKVSIQTLTLAIRRHGIYAYDQVDLLHKADEDDLQIASDLLVQQYQYEKDPFTYQLRNDGLALSPLERCQELPRSAEEAEEWGNPYDRFGWPKNKLPDFDKIDQSQTPPITSSPTACGDFCTLPNLHWDEVTISLVGDKGDGLAGNNMLEIRARDITRRITLGEADLVDRRSGSLNYQSAVLVRMAMGDAVKKTEKSGDMTAVMKHLRNALRKLIGLTEDPFHGYHKEKGWLPLFHLLDQRGLGDQRAAIAAERRTVSYEQLQEIGVQFEAKEDTEEGKVDATDDWLSKNDPTRRG